jgi:hypothetical protein
MTLYRVVNAADAITAIEDVGEEIRRLHITREGAQEAIKGVYWEEEWGKKPVLEVVEVTRYATASAAMEDWWQIVK